MEVVIDAEGLRAHHAGVVVPTMGALHAGHAALIERARALAGSERPVVVTLFVNPTQFNDPEDFARYPRTLEADLALAERCGADAVFVPSVEVVYPGGMAAREPVALPAVATRPGLEDAHRPGHFEGVCRVCARLFDLMRPSSAVFGEKDWQQLQVIRAMVSGEGARWGGMGVVSHPTVREPDGLALSSRNVRLSPAARAQALSLSRALRDAAREADAASAERAGARVLREAGVEPEYFVVRDSETLEAVRPGRAARALVAAVVGSVRLIDNERVG